jgi:hypothetical protein
VRFQKINNRQQHGHRITGFSAAALVMEQCRDGLQDRKPDGTALRPRTTRVAGVVAAR